MTAFRAVYLSIVASLQRTLKKIEMKANADSAVSAKPEIEERVAQPGMPPQEPQVTGLAGSRSGRDDLRGRAPIRLRPPRKIADRVKHESPVRKGLPRRPGQASRTQSEKVCDAGLGGRPDSRGVSPELPRHPGNDGEGDVADVEPVPGAS